MKKTRLILLCVLLAFLLMGCTMDDPGDVQVIQATEASEFTHEEVNLTGVLSFKDENGDTLGFIDSQTGKTYILGYHGGVRLLDKFGNDITKASLNCGTVCDCVFYADTKKLVSVQVNADTTVLTGIKKFSVSPEEKKAVYRGVSVDMWESVTAYEGENSMQVDEISTEDEVTLSILRGKLMSVVVTKGHGYVRLLNQDTYLGGLVEIGYDVIVPVTEDMLVAVGEGDYTLRINKDGYMESKEVHVKRDKENVVDLVDIAIPDGTVNFNVEPLEEEDIVHIYVDGEEISGFTYTGLYGTHRIKIEADNFDDFSGSFRINQPTTKKTVNLTRNTPTTTEEVTTETTETTASADTAATTAITQLTSSVSSTQTTTEAVENAGKVTENKIHITSPENVGVYMDGDYVGVTPLSVTKVVGVHTITLYRSGYLIKTYTITATDNEEDMKLDYPELTAVGSE